MEEILNIKAPASCNWVQNGSNGFAHSADLAETFNVCILVVGGKSFWMHGYIQIFYLDIDIRNISSLYHRKERLGRLRGKIGFLKEGF